MDQIRISDLEVFFRVGVPDEERAKPQRLFISADIEIDLAPAAATDNISKTIDYQAVVQRIMGLGEQRQWKLIEKLASDIGDLILREFGADAVTVEVKKFVIPQTQFVSVTLWRDR